jgi:hypothetical protein
MNLQFCLLQYILYETTLLVEKNVIVPSNNLISQNGFIFFRKKQFIVNTVLDGFINLENFSVALKLANLVAMPTKEKDERTIIGGTALLHLTSFLCKHGFPLPRSCFPSPLLLK